MSSNPSNLEDYAFLITGPMQGSFGTGFAIYADNDYTYVVTAYHVVKDVSGKEKNGLLVEDTEAELIAFDYDKKGFDLAILRVARKPDWQTVQPNPKQRAIRAVKTRVCTAGCLAYGDADETCQVEGTLGTRAKWRSKKLKTRTDVWHFKLDAGCTLEPGYSGSPLVDSAGVLIGVVIYQGNSGGTGTAVDIEALLSIWPEMPPGLKELFPERTARKPPSRSLLHPTTGLKELFYERTARKRWLPITVLTVFVALLLLCGLIRTKFVLALGSGSLPLGLWPLPAPTIQIAANTPKPSPAVTPLPQCPNIQIDRCLELDLVSGTGQRKCPLPGKTVIALSKSDIHNLQNLAGKALVTNGDGCTCQWQDMASAEPKAKPPPRPNDCAFSFDLEEDAASLLLKLETGGHTEFFTIQIEQ